MANIKISLDTSKTVNNVNRYSDIDAASPNLSTTLYDEQAIKSSIYNILTWKPFERILNPSFGNTLWNNIFENIGHTSKGDIVNAVKKMLSVEPRIIVNNIDVALDIPANEITVSFSYKIIDSDVENSYELTIRK